MIRVDISRLIPPRLGFYLLGTIPGVFFEASVAIGNPSFAVSAISRVRDIYPFGPYALFALFLASGMFLGQGFFLAAGMVNVTIVSAVGLSRYVFRSLIRNTFGSRWFYQWIGKIQGMPPKQNGFIRLLNRAMSWARMRDFTSKARPAMKCLYIAVQRLLKVRYGIDRKMGVQWDNSEWGVWYSALGKPLNDFMEASVSSKTFLACGIAGFAALYASPPLRVWYFVTLCLIFTFSGCFTSVDLARWRFNPVRNSMAKLRSVLLELSEVNAMTEKAKGDSEKAGVALAAHDDD